ncbi:NOL8 protein, partial [Zapornia atra]|nr:NOL8 protein [Zapornia atra]
MEKTQVSKRLYVGGLGHTVSKDELQERFGEFGQVLDVEIITRKDDQGNPLKTFAYISASISDADLRKCMSVLNKAKWKGGTLQIELAKESFLHRLAVEREEAKLQKEKPQRNDKAGLIESLKKAGVVDFHMKAVPGTEVPDHKKWVVGKFGRVLPVLHLRNQQKNKISFLDLIMLVFKSFTQNNIVKYDPSKYCHNLRKLEQDLTRVVPISELTWHLEEREDDINKKRQGQFPITKKPPKKPRQLSSEALNGGVVLSSGCQSHSEDPSTPQLDPRSKSKPNGKSKLPPLRSSNSKISGKGLLPDKSNVSGVPAVSDSDIDSEEEIRAMVEKETETQKAEHVWSESDHLEIVGDNFKLKYNSHWSLSKSDATKKAVKGSNRGKETVECDNGYDSADTDEIIAESKTSNRGSRRTAILEDSKQVKVESKEISTNKKYDLVNESSLKTCTLNEEHAEGKGKIKKSKTAALQRTVVNSAAKASDSESSSSEPEGEESEISSDYESMMQNCYRLDLTLDDLKALATENTGSQIKESGSTQSSSQSNVEENLKGNVGNKPKTSKFHPAAKKCICPEDVVAAILAGEENASEESSKGQNNSRLKYQPFRGMASLCQKESPKDSTALKQRPLEILGLEASVSHCGKASAKSQSKKPKHTHCEQHEEMSDAASLADERDQPVSQPRLQGKNKDASTSEDDQSIEGGDAASSSDQSEDGSSDEDSSAAVSQKQVKRQLKSPKLLSKKLKRDVSNKNPESVVKQLQDNQRRLAALEERQKERELQKKLIQGALSNLDSQPAGKRKHIVFDSDVESEADVDEMLKEDTSFFSPFSFCVTKDEPAAKTSSRLFESSEDEEDDTDDERFKIKPQFEGKAGEKLLKLQSRFGTDERFRMDARFLESDSEEEADTKDLKEGEEEELEAEKKKNLQILGSLLNINLEHPKLTKIATSAKKFR